MNDYIITIDENGSPSLQHYGVLGMKWGVRRNRQKAYQKATKRANKLQSAANKKTEKAKKATAHTPSRGLRYVPVFGESVYNFSIRRINAKQGAAARAQMKADKWMKSMEKVFDETKLKDVK